MITAIIPHYYAERRSNLMIIVNSLLGGTLPPSEILIWNNEHNATIQVSGALVIQSPRNVGAQARVVAAMIARGERLLFLDNDMSVNDRTVENLYQWSLKLDGVVTLEGRERPTPLTPYQRWPKIYGKGLTEPRPVFLSLGRGEMMRRSVLQSVASDFPFEPTTVMDDLHLSNCFMKRGVSVNVIPSKAGESDLRDLPMGGVGLCRTPDFVENRNRVAITIACDYEALKSQAESA